MLLLICILLFAILLVMGVPIIVSLGAPSALWTIMSDKIPLMMFGQKLFTSCDSFAMLAVPFFMLAGQIMERADITKKLVDFANACVGWIRGGIAMTVELAGILLAGLSGSSNADTSALGVLCYRQLRDSGYEEGFANAVVVSAGSIGPIIPPSICMIVYANTAGLNIGKLFMCGIAPGVLMGLGYMTVCYIYAKKLGIERTKFLGMRNLALAFKDAIGALIMPLIIVGGIAFGIFTATESGVAAVVYGIIYGFVRKKLTIKSLVESVRDAVHASVAPIALISISSVFSYMLAREGIITAIARFCGDSITNPVIFLAFVAVICIISGCFVDGTAVMLLLTPIFLPIATSMGIDPLHFSIVFILSLTTGGMTPPVGSQLFVMAGISKTPITKMVKPISSFMLVYFIVIVTMILVPQIPLFIPSLMG